MVRMDGDLDRGDRVGLLATEAGQQPVANHEVPSVAGQGVVAEHEGDRVHARDHLAAIALGDEDELGEQPLDVAVEQPADGVVAHELRLRVGHVPHGLDEAGPVGEDRDGERHLDIVPGTAG